MSDLSSKEPQRILIVEDFKGAVKILSRKLSPVCGVDETFNGDEAIQLLRDGRNYCAILLDLVMPKLDGYHVIKFIRDKAIQSEIIVMTAQPTELVNKRLRELGVKYVFSKPLDYDVLLNLVEKLIEENRNSMPGETIIDSDSGMPLPVKKIRKSCYICGYDNVQVFYPIKDAFQEDWSHGGFPVYKSNEEYCDWDHLKTYISVCPYCFFSSSDPGDFAISRNMTYPYIGESKNILVKSMSARKKIVLEAKDVDERFSLPNRSRETVIESILLADKCANGLILGGKEGMYCQQGIYSILLGAIHHPHGQKYYQESLNSFENQLKKAKTGILAIKSHYFSLVLNMLLHRTILGRDIMKKVESLYYDRSSAETSDEEKQWLMRLEQIWQTGVDSDSPRNID